MRWLAIGLAIITVGCSEGPGAEKRYQTVARSGSAQEKCAAARDAQQAYLKDGNEAKYKDMQLVANIECMAAEGR